MLTLHQIINSLFMYAYLQYYAYKIRADRRFMLKELHSALVDDLKRVR